jgi:hypothetical protein
MFVIRKKVIYGLEKNAINTINRWMDISRKLIKKYIQYEFLIDCKVRKLIPRSMRIKERKDCKTRKYIILIRTMENEVLRNVIWDKRKDVKKLRKIQERLKVKLEDRHNIFTKEAVLEDLNEWEDSFKEKIEKEMRRKREIIGLD